MRALLLAAGFGTRLRPITNHIPKCLVPINGKPLLAYWLDLLLNSNFEKVLINTHYLSTLVIEFISSSPWRDLVDLVYEPELLQTGGTILANKDWFKNQSFLVAHADNLTLFDPSKFITQHASRPINTEFTMMTFDADEPHNCGIIEEANGVVIGFHEKVKNPPGLKANAAVYIFEPSIITFLESFKSPFIDLSTQVIPQFLGKINTYPNIFYHRDIGTPTSLELAQREFPDQFRRFKDLNIK